ncbi:hypothetical protein JCM10213_007529 [Rhodosporidiobolus nylandii]
MLSRLAVLLALVGAAQAAITVKDGKLAVIDAVGATAVASSSFSSEQPSPLTYTLSGTDALKLSFVVVDSDTGSAVQPHQAALSWTSSDESNGEDVTQFVKVNRKTGRARWELDLSRAPPSLLSLPSPLTLTLLLASPSQPPLRLPLGHFTLPASLALPAPFPPDADLPRAWDVERYKLREPVQWTFREGEKRVGLVKALGGTAVVLAPWVVFGGALPSLLPSLRLTSPTPTSTLFLALLLLLESSFLLYWTDLTRLNLIQSLPVFGGLALLAAGVGRSALGGMRRQRLAKAAGAGKKSE